MWISGQPQHNTTFSIILVTYPTVGRINLSTIVVRNYVYDGVYKSIFDVDRPVFTRKTIYFGIITAVRFLTKAKRASLLENDKERQIFLK